MLYACLQTMDDVISVSYSMKQSYLSQDTEDDQQKLLEKEMSLQSLKNLQSRLMLIIGKDSDVKEEVDRFVEVIQKNDANMIIS